MTKKVKLTAIIEAEDNAVFDDSAINNTIGKLPIFAKTAKGYNNLVKLSSKSFLETMENQFPTCSLDDLFDNSKDLLILSGGIDSLFNALYIILADL